MSPSDHRRRPARASSHTSLSEHSLTQTLLGLQGSWLMSGTVLKHSLITVMAHASPQTLLSELVQLEPNQEYCEIAM